MASISLDRKTRWWSVRYLVSTVPKVRAKKVLCKHEGALPRAGKGKKTPVPYHVAKLAEPFVEAERLVKLGHRAAAGAKTGLAEYAETYIAASAATHAAKTRRQVARAVRGFVAYCKSRKVTAVQGVSPPLCRAYLAEQGKTLALSTLRTHRGYLTPLFTQARKDRVITENPWEFVRVAGKTRQERPTFWTADEVGRLLAVLDGWHRDCVVLAVNTGIRISALLSLKWSDVDWGRGVVCVRASASKSGRPYEVPFTETSRNLLQRMKGEHVGPNSDLIFTNPETGRRYATQTTYEFVKVAVRRAGVPDYGDYNHVLRRTFATLAIDAGKPLAVVSRWLGHSSIRTTQVYLGHRT